MRISLYALIFTVYLFSCDSNSSNSIYTISNEDFHELDHLFEGKQVIFLGEPSHGDGTIFEERVKLIKYLVENHGFRNIVFESSLYDAEKINELKANGTLQREDFGKATFDIWGNVSELDELWDFIASTPEVSFRGMDFQPHLMMRDHFLSDLEAIVKINEVERDLLTLILNKISGTTISKREHIASTEELELLKSVQRKIDAERNTENLSQGLKAIQNYLFLYTGNFSSNDFWARHSFRDSLMFEQLNYHKTKFEKVIVWLASAHSLQRPDLITPTDEMDSLGMDYSGYIPVGKRAKEAYGNTMLNIAYTGLEGSFRDFIENEHIAVNLNTKNTIESAIIAKTGKPTYLNLHKIDSTFTSGVLGYEPMQADWSKNFDGIIILPLVEPSTPK